MNKVFNISTLEGWLLKVRSVRLSDDEPAKESKILDAYVSMKIASLKTIVYCLIFSIKILTVCP